MSWAHATAIVEDGAQIGDGTTVWDHAHVRAPARVGRDCIVGGKAYVGPGASIGDRVKLNSFTYVCTGVTLEDGVMVSAGAVFTNDRYPRATTPGLDALRPSDIDALPTVVRAGATIGAGAIVGCDLEIGTFAIAGMGAVVTRSVPSFHLVVGNPARPVGCVCRCGVPFLRFAQDPPADGDVACPACGRRYSLLAGVVHEHDPR